MKTLIEQIKKLREHKKSAADIQRKILKKQILILRTELEDKTLLNAQKNSQVKISPRDITEPQRAFYDDIHKFFVIWIDENIDRYLRLDRLDRKNPSKEEIKITIKRIAELLNTEWNTKTFSDLVFEFKTIQADELYVIAKKHSHLKKDM